MTDQNSQKSSDVPGQKRWVPAEHGELTPENREFLQHLESLISDDRHHDVLAIIHELDEVDIAELMIYVPLRKARKLYAWLPPELAADILEALNPDLRAVLMQDSDVARITEIVEELEDDDAVE